MAPPTYRGAASATLRIVPLDTLTVIYHRSSGITHVVDSPVPEILEMLGQEPLTAAALLDRMAFGFALVDGDLLALEARLEELVSAGLVERTCGT